MFLSIISKYKITLLSIVISIASMYISFNLYINNIKLEDTIKSLQTQIISYDNYCKDQILLQDKYNKSISILKDPNESIIDKFNNINSIYNDRMLN